MGRKREKSVGIIYCSTSYVTVLVIPVVSNKDMKNKSTDNLKEARKELENEVGECLELKEDSPEIWQILFGDEIDPETLAFYILPDETREKLWN